MFLKSENGCWGVLWGGVVEFSPGGQSHLAGCSCSSAPWGDSPSLGRGSWNAWSLHLEPSGMCFGVKHWNYPQRKDSVVRFLAAASAFTPAAEAPRTRPLLGGVWLQGPGGWLKNKLYCISLTAGYPGPGIRRGRWLILRPRGRCGLLRGVACMPRLTGVTGDATLEKPRFLPLSQQRQNSCWEDVKGSDCEYRERWVWNSVTVFWIVENEQVNWNTNVLKWLGNSRRSARSRFWPSLAPWPCTQWGCRHGQIQCCQSCLHPCLYPRPAHLLASLWGLRRPGVPAGHAHTSSRCRWEGVWEGVWGRSNALSGESPASGVPVLGPGSWPSSPDLLWDICEYTVCC